MPCQDAGTWWNTASREKRLRFSGVMIIAAVALIIIGIIDDDLVALVIGLGGGAFVALQFRRGLERVRRRLTLSGEWHLWMRRRRDCS